jgi:hypothetical protein
MSCPYGVGCGGSRCKNCLKDVNLNEYVAFYSERPEAFRINYNKVKIVRCCR